MIDRVISVTCRRYNEKEKWSTSSKGISIDNTLYEAIIDVDYHDVENDNHISCTETIKNYESFVKLMTHVNKRMTELMLCDSATLVVI